MSDLSVDMKATADYAIKSAKDRYNLELDYSRASIAALETILGKIYWGFIGRTEDEGKRGVIYTTAIIWGSYLGEFMRQKWGGSWTRRGSDLILSISNQDFFPIDYVYEKITGRKNNKIADYLFEINGLLGVTVSTPPPTRDKTISIDELEEQIVTKKTVAKKKDLLYAIIGIGGIFIVIIAFILVMLNRNRIAIPVSEVYTSPTNTLTNTPEVIITFTPSPTITTLPTYTPKPTATPQPSRTPSPTYTQTATLLPTDTPTVTFRPSTFTPTSTSTTEPPPPPPPDTPIPPTEPPPPTSTPLPPAVLESCEVDPSSIQPGFAVILTFTAHFSAPGYGFDAEVDGDYPGASGCSGVDDNGDGTASCNGSSGMVPSTTTVDVTFSSSVGDCTASYGTP